MDSKSQGIKNPSFSGAGRCVPLDVDTARELGGGSRGRTLAIIYRQLCYWSKYAKWKGSKNRKFFYKSQRELAEELGYSEKTINRAIKALRELGLIVVEQLHKRYWRQTFFYYLPQSPYAKAEASAQRQHRPSTAPPQRTPERPMERSCSTTIKPSSRNALTAVRAGEATAKSIRARGGAGFGQNVRIQHKKTNPLIKQTLQAIVERCEAMGVRMNEQEGVLSTT